MSSGASSWTERIGGAVLGVGRGLSPVQGMSKWMTVLAAYVAFVGGMSSGAQATRHVRQAPGDVLYELGLIDGMIARELSADAPQWYADGWMTVLGPLFDVVVWCAARGVGVGTAVPDLVLLVEPAFVLPPVAGAVVVVAVHLHGGRS